ncbi:MAG: M56 family metallopeptidase [Pyrinomonadaceae bacterium]|nr:M56 family metallopeptidase [Pyrinomonadaceae bacterium]
MFFLLGICILLAVMLALNSIASLVASLVWKVLKPRACTWSAASQASVLCLLRTLPVVGGVTIVALLFAPAYLAHEPRENHEEITLNLAIVAFFSALGVVLALVRGIVSWRATARLTADWLRNAEAITLPGITIPAFRIEHQFPVVAIVGTFRPRLFIANQILQSLTSDELSAALAHEVGHVIARDNLKRGVLRACRDMLLIIPCGRGLDRAWKESSESAADEYAAGRDRMVGLDLASALVKIARLVPYGSRPTLPAGAYFVNGEDPSGFRARIRNLVRLAGSGSSEPPAALIGKLPLWVPIAILVVLLGAVSIESHVLVLTHEVIEHAVYLLS